MMKPEGVWTCFTCKKKFNRVYITRNEQGDATFVECIKCHKIRKEEEKCQIPKEELP
jgi:cytochrome c2